MKLLNGHRSQMFLFIQESKIVQEIFLVEHQQILLLMELQKHRLGYLLHLDMHQMD